jgi:hypothetical protein
VATHTRIHTTSRSARHGAFDTTEPSTRSLRSRSLQRSLRSLDTRRRPAYVAFIHPWRLVATLHVGTRSRGACFELVALRAQQEAPSPARLVGVAADLRNSRRPEATRGNGTARDSRSTAVRHSQPHRSAPPWDRETSAESPVRDFLVTRGRTLGNRSSTRSGSSPARLWP